MPPVVDVAIVLFDSAPHVERLLASLAVQTHGKAYLHVILVDNASSDDGLSQAEAVARRLPLRVTCVRNASNVGFGAAINIAARQGDAPFIFVLNPDTAVAPDCISELMEAANGADRVGIVEARQRPREHPKYYDPVTLETTWASAAACLVRRQAFEAVGGFDEALFLYCEDVDLSWRIRAAGYRCIYAPRAAVTHDSFDERTREKPLQALYGTCHNFFLRWRFGSARSIIVGYVRWALLMLRVRRDLERRSCFFRAFRMHVRLIPAAVARRRQLRPAAVAKFVGWDYESTRPGCGAPALPATSSKPLVTVVVRTRARPTFLREALTSIANQTYDNIEVVVAEDGTEDGRKIVEADRSCLRIKYVKADSQIGRSRIGNLGVEHAEGSFVIFLDDDDVFFADHVETLVHAVEHAGLDVGFSLSFAARQRVRSIDPLAYEIVERNVVHDHGYDRVTLFHHNYLPVQSVIFSRRLFAEVGGLDESLNALEDWDLWLRFSLAGEEFAFAPRTTSEYRLRNVDQADQQAERARQAALDETYTRIVGKHARAQVPLTFLDLHRLQTRIHHAERAGQLAQSLKSGRGRAALRLIWKNRRRFTP